MRARNIGLGVVTTLVIGIAMFSNDKPQPVQPTPAPISGIENLLNSLQRGTVVANDETPSSPPRQHVKPPQTMVEITHEVKKAAAKKAGDKYVTINNKEYPLRTYRTLQIPNDPLAAQWSMANAKLDEAWDIPRGNHETVLAIIDTGFGLQHEEFSNRWYANPGETGSVTNELPSALNCSDRGLPLSASCNLIDDNNDTVIDNETGVAAYQNPSRLNCTDQLKPLTKDCNRIDDDSNGYIDDVNGWDFINYDNSVQAGELNPDGTGTQHGTMVAGVAAATGNNGKGIAGVDWGTKIMPIQALDDDSYGDTLSVGRAILYAAAQGADVISLSLGSDLPDPYVEEAVRTAIASGSVVVAAAGNDGCDCMVYPAHYPEVVAVGALQSNSQPASFSSWGQNLDILAPGTHMTSSTWTSGNQTSAYSVDINGTSFATPMVGGILTRLLSQQPTATPLQLIAALTENTNRLTLPVTTPRSSTLGFGSLDAKKASLRMVTPKTLPVLYGLVPLSQGNQIYPDQPSEAPGTYAAYDCQDGNIATTPLFELNKAGSRIFSISQAEIQKAVAAGYASQLFMYTCLQQPHDTPASVRLLDLFREFRNTSSLR